MKKLTMLAGAISLAILSGCNSSDQALEVTARETTSPSASAVALRNMATDIGNAITAPNAVDVPAAEGIGNLVDGDPNSKFLTFSTDVTLNFTSTSAYVLKGYNFVSANDQPMRDPALWTLEASTDGENWQQLDSQSNQTFAGRAVKNSYDLASNELAYQYYRFDITHGGTDEYGVDIVQIGELELMVAADKPLVAFKTNKARAQVGEAVYFLDQSLANPTSWQWAFEDGTPATSTEQHPTVSFNTLGPKSVTLVAGNDKGSNTLVQEQVLQIWDPANPWAGFSEPAVSFVKTDPQHAGQLALEQMLPDLEEQIKTTSFLIAKMLYQDVTEIPQFKTVTFETGHYDFPAAKSGTETDMLLYMDLEHINNVAGNGADALRAEVLGMLWHELTHGYSGAPQTGQYAAGDEYHTFLESVADFVRIKAGYNEHKRAGVKWVNTWNDDAYNQTSFFLEWVDNSYKSIDFIKQFIQQAKTLQSWSYDAAFKAILGQDRGIEVLWNEYQVNYLQNVLGLTPPFPTPVLGYRNFAIDEGVSISTDATDIGIWGEGVDQLIDNNVTIKFNAVIEIPWWIPEYAPDLMPINEVDAVSVDVALPQAQVLHKYSVSTGNDNPHRDPTTWTVSGSQDGLNWTQLGENGYPQAPERLTTYHFDVVDNLTAFNYYRFVFDNAQQGDGIGGDNGRLVQIGELALLTEQP